MNRIHRLMPGGIPRWVRCYDNGGRSFDRYTVVFTRKSFGFESMYLAMSEHPMHPQGFGQHGHSKWFPVDVVQENGRCQWPPAIGRKCHLGVRIPFATLPTDCQRLVVRDYKEIWNIETKGTK